MELSQFRELFVSEALNHLSQFSHLIIRLEQNITDKSTIDELFRHAHSLKGMAATMQFNDISHLSHRIEDLLSQVRSGTTPCSQALANLLLEAGDTLLGMTHAIERGDEPAADVNGLSERLSTFVLNQEGQQIQASGDAQAPPSPHGLQQTNTLNAHQPDPFKTVRIKTRTLDRLVSITGELMTIRHHLSNQAQLQHAVTFEQPLHQLALLLKDLRDEVFQARMLPFAFISERFPRLVRDLAQQQGKEIELHIEGKEIELDRGILEEIVEPLMHLLRNAVDHGIESSDERVRAGKSSAGTLIMMVTRNQDRVDIVVSDDGRGMKHEQLIAVAREKGLLTADQADALTPPEALMLICAPGFSTAREISAVSGRGVGMDVVKSAVHSLGGRLSISSTAGSGSNFILQLPLTVSIIPALLVTCGLLTIAFPVSTVARTIEVSREDIFEVNGRKEIVFDGRTIPLRSLNHMLGQALPQRSAHVLPAVVVHTAVGQLALLTDGLSGQLEIFVKPLGAPLSRMKFLCGGSISGNGSIIFVIDTSTMS